MDFNIRCPNCGKIEDLVLEIDSHNFKEGKNKRTQQCISCNEIFNITINVIVQVEPKNIYEIGFKELREYFNSENNNIPDWIIARNEQLVFNVPDDLKDMVINYIGNKDCIKNFFKIIDYLSTIKDGATPDIIIIDDPIK